MASPRSVEIWRGPSRIDGAPIVVIATGLRGDSQNRKTGAMIQTWILRADIEPHIAAKDGSDVSICGDCPHRRDENGHRTCYVRVQDAPLKIFRSWSSGKIPPMAPSGLGDLARDRRLPVRIGAYGDPGAVPITVWKPIVSRAPRITAYTHRSARSLIGMVPFRDGEHRHARRAHRVIAARLEIVSDRR